MIYALRVMGGWQLGMRGSPAVRVARRLTNESGYDC